jgi:hypothetical protein
MKALVSVALGVFAAAVNAQPLPPLRDAVVLNIGINCQWQQRCMSDQHHAMKRALKYVRKYQPPMWRIQQCNRNASRSPQRVDWAGYDHCIRNASLQYTPPPARKAPSSHRRRKHKPRAENVFPAALTVHVVRSAGERRAR